MTLVLYLLFLQRDETRASSKYGYLMKRSEYSGLKVGESRTKIENRYPKPAGIEKKPESVGTFYTPCTYYVAFEGTASELEIQKDNWGGLPDRTYRLCYTEDGDTGIEQLASKRIVGRWKEAALDTPPLNTLSGGKSQADDLITRIEYDAITPGMARSEVHDALGSPTSPACDSYRDERDSSKGYSICYDLDGFVDKARVVRTSP